MLIGPSIGHLYAGKLFTPGLGVRALGFGLAMAAFDDESIGMLLLGTACVVGGAIADISTAGSSARAYNFEHANRTMSPTVAPVVDARGNATGMQVGLVGNF